MSTTFEVGSTTLINLGESPEKVTSGINIAKLNFEIDALHFNILMEKIKFEGLNTEFPSSYFDKRWDSWTNNYHNYTNYINVAKQKIKEAGDVYSTKRTFSQKREAIVIRFSTNKHVVEASKLCKERLKKVDALLAFYDDIPAYRSSLKEKVVTLKDRRRYQEDNSGCTIL
jgi:hypothetical protein